LYEQITRNKVRSVLLILAVLVLAGGLGYLFGYFFGGGVFGLVLALAIAAVMSFASYRYGDRIVLRVSRAKPAGEQEYPRLHNIVEGLAIAAGIPKPAVYVIPEEAPNAFATGRNPEHASVAVTQGLLDTLNRVELEGVLAHELAHVRNRDMLVNTLAATLVGVVVLIAGWMRWGLFWGGMGRGRDRGGGGGGGGNPIALILLVLSVVAMILAPLAAQLIRFAVSRRREYLADADGALISRYPPGLASALRKIAAASNTMRVANNATAHIWFSQPSRAVGEGHSRIERLFSTHPPIEDRIRILEEM
jgi:heat shock protein HtpX